MPKVLFSLALLLLTTPLSFAWGPEGHRIVADVARSHLTPAARLQVRELLGSDDLASVSVWADDIKPERPETAGWHFVDIPMNASGFSQARDCYRPDAKHPSSVQDHHNCVIDRIEMFKQVLADRKASRQERTEALKFLVHFVADIHQPLHAIGEARGGNDIHVIEFGSSQCGSRPCNLHFAWDIGLIEHSGLNESDYTERLRRLIWSSRFIIYKQAEETPKEWANESFQLAKKVWLRDGGAVDDAYYRANIEVVNHQLALAGLRLAKMLDEALGDTRH